MSDDDESMRDERLSRRLVLALPLVWVGCEKPSSPSARRELTTREPTAIKPEAAGRSEPAPGVTSKADTAQTSAEATAPSSKPKRRKESPHVLHVPAADIASGGAKAYSVFGDGHAHPITVDATAMAKLAASKFALVKSGPGGPDHHAHWVSVYAA